MQSILSLMDKISEELIKHLGKLCTYIMRTIVPPILVK